MNIYDTYRRTATTVSMINYHFVFCPRRRRKIFKVAGVETRFKDLVSKICEENQIEILAIECHVDHCHLFVNAPPTLSPAQIMKLIKGCTGRVLRQEFFTEASCQFWTRSYFVSTAGNVSTDSIKYYVEPQKRG